MRSFDVFFDLHLKKRLIKQSRRWWLQALSRWLWRHCNENCFQVVVKVPTRVSSVLLHRPTSRTTMATISTVCITSQWRQERLENHWLFDPKRCVHDDVIKWKHFPRNWPFVREIHRSPVNFPHKGQWRGALMFSLIYAWINDWVNNREAGDLRRQHGHYDVIVMQNFKNVAFKCNFCSQFHNSFREIAL